MINFFFPWNPSPTTGEPFQFRESFTSCWGTFPAPGILPQLLGNVSSSGNPSPVAGERFQPRESFPSCWGRKLILEIFQPFLPGLRVHPNQHAHDNNQAGRKQYYYRTHFIFYFKFQLKRLQLLNQNLSEIFQPFLPGFRVHPNQEGDTKNQADRI